MDPVKIGALIRSLRTERRLTQKQLAEALHVSDKAVSKWERGNGCPDLSLLAALADFFGMDMEILLSGEISTNESEKGNMKKLKFYVCQKCGNILTATSEAAVSCCGIRLAPIEPKPAEESEMLRVEDIGGELYVTADHSMTKEHYISFAAYVSDSSVTICKQYPEWDMQMTLPPVRSGRLVWYCTKCGMFRQEIRRKK